MSEYEITTKPAEIPEFEDLFYKHMIRGISGWDDLIHIGRNNVQTLIAHLRGTEKSITTRIHQIKDEQDILRGKSGEDIKEAASEFENPVGIRMAVREDSWTKDPEPIDATSIIRGHKSTTFNVCGWCKYASAGTSRYNYAITPTCRLLRNNPAWNPEGATNTPCRLHDMTAEQFQTIIDFMEMELAAAKRRRAGIQRAIAKLQKLQEGQIDKPYLMTLRPYDMFELGDRVMLFIGGHVDEKCVDGQWAPAKVIMGYRHHDGCVSVCADFPIWKRRDYLDGAGAGFGASRPECLPMSTYLYLRKEIEGDDRHFVDIWILNAHDLHMTAFNPDHFAKALRTGMVATSDEIINRDVEPVKDVESAQRVLNMLMLPRTRKELVDWHRFMVKTCHPDQFNSASDETKVYLNRQVAAFNAARDLLIKELDLK